ncbi:MAG: ligase-associated DNA damage response DEXH box helicase [Flavobacteriales bacterium]|nr:ligase-associated DNA damage response DEXH box helicase [Flavobacteriales bacterium]
MTLHPLLEQWMSHQGWKPAPFQLHCWQEVGRGANGLLSAATGSGKTYALWLGFLNAWLHRHVNDSWPRRLRLLWITPLRALSYEIAKALQKPLADIEIPMEVLVRTGDSTAQEKKNLFSKPPHVLVTTPESLHIILASRGYPALLENLEGLIVDEWHELIGTKRGVMTELAVAWIRRLSPNCLLWGISATFGNLNNAAKALFGSHTPQYVLVEGPAQKPIYIRSIVPNNIEDLPQSGHIGLRLLEKTLPIIRRQGSTLIFTNTRSQSELWYQHYLTVCPELAGQLALHHGSLDGELRHWVENRLKDGHLKAVVCTSSLDLGVDFLPVERVIQVGSPKSSARFIQRAGRSGHAPGRPSRVWFVPTHSMELVEGAALRQAVRRRFIEPPPTLPVCWDVLMQFMTTLAVSQGFTADTLWAVVRQTHTFANITWEDFQKHLAFAAQGGQALTAYEDYRRMEIQEGKYRVRQPHIARRHRLQIGVIPSDSMMWVRLTNGKRLGQIEEWFLSGLETGEAFWFAGQSLRLKSIRDNEAWVEPAPPDKARVPSWMGGRLPLSSQLAHLILEMFGKAREGDYSEPELKALRPLLELQLQMSDLPHSGFQLIEQFSTRLGHHTLLYPMEGRIAHEAIGALLAFRLSKLMPIRVSLAMNDYGLEIQSDRPLPLSELWEKGLFSTQNLDADLQQSVNAVEIARRRFRDIARVAGLVFDGYPDKRKKARHLQASASLLFEVLSEHDPGNLLLRQAIEEAFAGLEFHRVHHYFHQLATQPVKICHTQTPTPLSIPIITDRLRHSLSSLNFEEELASLLYEKDTVPS